MVVVLGERCGIYRVSFVANHDDPCLDIYILYILSSKINFMVGV